MLVNMWAVRTRGITCKTRLKHCGVFVTTDMPSVEFRHDMNYSGIRCHEIFRSATFSSIPPSLHDF